MDALTAIAYTSHAVRGLAPWTMDAMLLDARRFNAQTGVTGVLFHHDGCFFQYIEGPVDGVDAVYRRIQASRTHHRLRELLHQPIARRQFADWTMGFCEPPRSRLQAMSHAQWLDAMPITRDTAENPEGLALVVHYWNKWQAEAFPRADRLPAAAAGGASYGRP